MYRIGVDIGGTNIALGILDEGWELLAQKSVPFQRGGEIVAAIIAQQIRAMLAETGIAESMLECIGIAVPGSITPDAPSASEGVSTTLIFPPTYSKALETLIRFPIP